MPLGLFDGTSATILVMLFDSPSGTPSAIIMALPKLHDERNAPWPSIRITERVASFIQVKDHALQTRHERIVQ